MLNYRYHLDPVLADMDGDGDRDLVIGDLYATLLYAENTGSSTAPAFLGLFSGPFGGAKFGQASSPALADLDGDGDRDAVVGENNGVFSISRIPAAPRGRPFSSSGPGPAILSAASKRAAASPLRICGTWTVTATSTW